MTDAAEVLSAEDIEGLRKHYDNTDVDAVTDSHETLRQKLQVVESIAERFADGWKALFPGMLVGAQWVHIACWGRQPKPDSYWLTEDMTAEQHEWFKEGRKKNA